MDIEVVEKVIKASVEEALKRMRQADERLTNVQQGRARAEMSTQLAEAMAEYNRGVAELMEYLNVSKRQSPHRDTDDTHT
jgi:outer membrane protein TolC